MQKGIRVKFKIMMFTECLLLVQGDQRTIIHLLLYLVELLINETVDETERKITP